MHDSPIQNSPLKRKSSHYTFGGSKLMWQHCSSCITHKQRNRLLHRCATSERARARFEWQWRAFENSILPTIYIWIKCACIKSRSNRTDYDEHLIVIFLYIFFFAISLPLSLSDSAVTKWIAVLLYCSFYFIPRILHECCCLWGSCVYMFRIVFVVVCFYFISLISFKIHYYSKNYVTIINKNKTSAKRKEFSFFALLLWMCV